MIVVVPADSVEAEKATRALAIYKGGAYLRLARDKTAVVTTTQTPFHIGTANVLRSGDDLTIVACGILVYQALIAAEMLSKRGIEVEVINSATVKPLDSVTILTSARKTRAVLTAEEGQIAGGLGGAVAELLGEHVPTVLVRVGIADRFGQSGTTSELIDHYGLSSENIVRQAKALLTMRAKHAL